MMVKKILENINGLRYRQEYLCLRRDECSFPFRVFARSADAGLRDVTDTHILAGYSPLIIAIPFPSPGDSAPPGGIRLIFTSSISGLNEPINEKDAIASLEMKLIRVAGGETGIFGFYEGLRGTHRIVAPVYQGIIALHNRLYNKKPGNVFLPGNLHRQVQIAYSVPRLISLVTVSDGRNWNIFPTDLHGPLGSEVYLDSLRKTGMACRQVEAAGKIVMCGIDASFYKTAYALGKNHMQALRSARELPLSGKKTEQFQWWIPEGAVNYRELELSGSFDHGIHRILLFNVVNYRILADESSSLAHVHNIFATWQHNKGLSGNYLLR